MLAVARAGQIDGGLGRAVLIACRGRAVIYCPAPEITAAGRRGPGCARLRAALGLARAVPGRVRVRIARAAHPSLRGCLHPAYISAPPGITAHACRKPDQRRARRRTRRALHRVRPLAAPRPG